MKSVLLNKHSLSVAKLAPKEESRYPLNAILVTDKESIVTNGHYLVRVSTPTMKASNFPIVPGDAETVETKSLLMPASAALETLKALPKKQTIPVLEYAKVGKDADGNIRATVTDLEIHKPMSFKPTTGTYPNWEAVIIPDRNRAPKATVCLNAKYLSDLAKAAGEVSEFVTLRIWEETRAVRIDAKTSEGQEWNCVLMPARGKSGAEFSYNVEIPDPFKDVPEYEPAELIEA